jgi:hypothetical protein
VLSANPSGDMNEKLTRPSSDGKSLVDRQGKIGAVARLNGYLTGFGEATISRWERGRLLQNRANDRYLRLLAERPENVQFLESLPPPVLMSRLA